MVAARRIKTNRDAAGQRYNDLRRYFTRRRRVNSDCGVNCNVDQPRLEEGNCKSSDDCNSSNDCNSSKDFKSLYRTPLQLEASGLSAKKIVENYQSLTQFLAVAKYQDEHDKLSALLEIHQIAWIIPLGCSTLALHIILKLLEAEEEPCDVERWLSSPALIRGIMALDDVIQSRKFVLDPNVGWDLLMLIEPMMHAVSFISTNTMLASFLAIQERILLHSALWSGQHIYTLLQQEQRPRARRLFISSPGKALRSMTTPNSPGVTPLEFFFRKFFRAAALVLDSVVTAEDLSSAVRKLSWTLFIAGIEMETTLKLMKNRHLLTIMACTVYSVAKLLDEDRPFASIIRNLQRHTIGNDESWFRQVPLNDGEVGDLVRFYNHTYLNCMRDRIYSLTNPKTPERHQPVPLTPFPSVPGSVPLSRNVTLQVSPGPVRATSIRKHTCIALLGNLGAHRRRPNINNNRVARKLHF